MARPSKAEAARAQALIEASGHGPHLPKEQWRAAMTSLHDQGVGLAAISRAFNCSPETVRQRLAGLRMRLVTDEEWELVLARRRKLAGTHQGR